MNVYGTMRYLAIALVATCTLASAQTLPPTQNGTFDGCPKEGRGGDASLNAAKNRWTDAAGSTPITVARMGTFPVVPIGSVPNFRLRSTWPATKLNQIESIEARGGVFEGYVISAKAEKAEACNCGSSSARDHDVHVYVADRQDQGAPSSAIVEVTPQWRAVNPTWNNTNIKSLADEGAHVRVTGRLLYDEEHWNMISKKQRSTLWELHPITNIEVQTSGGWVELAQFIHTHSQGNMLTASGPQQLQLVNTRSAALTRKVTKGANLLP